MTKQAKIEIVRASNDHDFVVNRNHVYGSCLQRRLQFMRSAACRSNDVTLLAARSIDSQVEDDIATNVTIVPEK